MTNSMFKCLDLIIKCKYILNTYYYILFICNIIINNVVLISSLPTTLEYLLHYFVLLMFNPIIYAILVRYLHSYPLKEGRIEYKQTE